MSRLVELADAILSEDEVIEALCSEDELKFLIAREVWNKRHPDEPIGEKGAMTARKAGGRGRKKAQ